jgi:hypothetical protein
MIRLEANIWTEMTEEASSRVAEGARRRVTTTKWFLAGILVERSSRPRYGAAFLI